MKFRQQAEWQWNGKKAFSRILSRDRFLVEQPRRDSPAISPDLDRPADFCPSRVSTSGPASRD